MKILDIPQIGKTGNMVSYRRPSGQFRRRYVVPNDPRTNIQMQRRRTMKSLRLLWSALTQLQRAAWIAAGQDHRTARRLNQSGPLSGFLFFIKINFNLATIGLPPVFDPPELPQFPDNPVEELAITNTNGAVAIQLRVVGRPTESVIVWATKPRSAGTTYADHFSILTVLPEPTGGVSDITAPFAAKYGLPPAGSRVFIEIVQQVNGWQTLPKRYTALVPGPQ